MPRSLSEIAYSRFQADNPEPPFNDDLIYFRENDNIDEYLEDVFSALQVIDGIEYLGLERETDESKFPSNLQSCSVDENRLDLVTIKFRLTKEEKEEKVVEEVSMPIFFPKFMDHFFFYLSSTLYFPIFQAVERGTYMTSRSFTLKTMFMPLMFRIDQQILLKDMRTEEEANPIYFRLDLFNKKINILLYMFSKFGFYGALDYFEIDEDKANLVEMEDLDEYPQEDWAAFEIVIAKRHKVALVANRKWLGTDQGDFPWVVIASLVDVLSKHRPTAHILMLEANILYEEGDTIEIDGEQKEIEPLRQEVETYWMKKLGQEFTKTPATILQKAQRIQVSLERLLDSRTRKNLAQVPDEDKEDIYSILRWMIRDYKDLSRIDNMDLLTKRIRLAEYFIHPLLIRFSHNTYRLLNSQKVTLKNLKSIFSSIHPDFVIQHLKTTDPIRYSSSVNQHDLFTVALRMTVRGPQSMGKQHLATRFRGHHESYIGRIGLCTSSATDPGATGTLVPFAKTDGQFFV